MLIGGCVWKARKKAMIHVVPKHQSTIYETNMETNMETEFKCERCKPGHDFKSKKNLKQHHQSSSHKRKFDPEFAAAEEAEKATKKAANQATRGRCERNSKESRSERNSTNSR